MPTIPATDTRTTRRFKLDVKKAFAFAEEQPTRPKRIDAHELTRQADDDAVTACVSLDAVPSLALCRADVSWADLSELAAELVLRIDGASPTMSVVTATSFTPAQGVRELGVLVQRGLVRLACGPAVQDDDSIDVDQLSFA